MAESCAQAFNPHKQKSPGPTYRPRSPENTVLFKIVRENFGSFLNTLENEANLSSKSNLPDYALKEIEAYLKCGVLSHGFVRMSCDVCKATLLVPLSCKKRGFCTSCIGKRMNEGAAHFVDSVIPKVPVRQWVLSLPMPARFWMAMNPRLMAGLLNIFIRAVNGYYRNSFLESSAATSSDYQIQTGSITVIQRFGGALNANIHFHTLFLDGVFISNRDSTFPPIFIRNKMNENGSESGDVENVLKTVQKRMIRHLMNRGLISKYENNPMPDQNLESTLFDSILGASVLGKIVMGVNRGKKVRRIGSFGTLTESAFKTRPMGATLAGFSLHAATRVNANDRIRLESLCRYLLRPPLSEKRLRRLSNGDVELRLKSEWSDGTHSIRFTPHEFIEKLIAIIPKPRIHQVRFHGILAPSATDRKKVVPASIDPPVQGELFEMKKPRPKRMGWAELLKRTFKTDMTACFICGGEIKFQRAVLKKAEILETLSASGLSPTPE